MECIKRRAVDNGRLVADQHPLCIIERVHHHCTSIPQPDLKDADSVFPPPRLTDNGMIIAESEKVTSDGQGTRNFGYALDVGDICCGGDLDDC